MRPFLPGILTLEITCADCATLLNALGDNHIRLSDVSYCSDLILSLKISRNDYDKLKSIAEKHGAAVKIIKKKGLYWTAKSVMKRPVLVIFGILLFLGFVFVPGRVFFISVEGNTSVPANQILETAAECGIRFGAVRRQLRSEKMKNALLQKMPQLQWAGVNTTGCTAVISVREKTTDDREDAKNNGVCSIVAARDGVIRSCTVYQGNTLCSVGQAVKAGQTLVSGYVDCGLVTKAVQAQAEIQALTFRDLEVISPAVTLQRGEVIRERTNFSLKIGKKLINFFQDSGNLDGTCAKIYSESYLHLPGGFRLPIAVIKETVTTYKETNDTPAEAESMDWLADFAQSYLRRSMVAGEIISAETDTNAIDSAHYLYGKYACTEMIGQVKYEQTFTKDEMHD